jgi:hypothetical protein
VISPSRRVRLLSKGIVEEMSDGIESRAEEIRAVRATLDSRRRALRRYSGFKK